MIRTIIVDDEQPSLNKLEKLLKDSGIATVEGKFTQPMEALEFLKENKVDVIFLDIEMPDIDGIELANLIFDQHGGDVVFVTAYNQYAIQAFELNALDYLMKPVTAERLIITLDRFHHKKETPPRGKDIKIQCFGRFRVTAGSNLLRFRTEKAEELLAYLIDNRGSVISRSKILDNLWGDFEGDRALIHFNTTLYYVKKAFQASNIPISIQYDRGSYLLDICGIDCDYIRFCSFFDNTKFPGWDDVPKMEETANLYIGEYLIGWESNWVVVKRLQMQEKYIALLVSLAEYYKSIGVNRRAIKWLNDALIHEPFDRALNYKLIELLLMMNEQLLADKQFEIYKNGLRDKHGMKPGEEFNLLFDRYKVNHE
ncbi:MAG TPA: response regulator [Anaerovoracaceae bacterium]|nr:response regulator [Anaerovoracaceae bacterium]